MVPGPGRAPAEDAELEELELERVKLPEAEEDMVDREILDMTAVAKGDPVDNSQRRAVGMMCGSDAATEFQFLAKSLMV